MFLWSGKFTWLYFKGYMNIYYFTPVLWSNKCIRTPGLFFPKVLRTLQLKLRFIEVNFFAHTLAFGQCHNMCDCLNRRYVKVLILLLDCLPAMAWLLQSGNLLLEDKLRKRRSIFLYMEEIGNCFSAWKCCYASFDCIRNI